jgi:protein TonB
MAVNFYVLHRDSTEPNKVIEYVYSISDVILREAHYSDYQQKVLHGSVKYWYPTGVLQTEENYSQGRLDGTLKTFWPGGQPRRFDVYAHGELTNGTVWDITGSEIKYFPFMVQPTFPGGDKERIKFLLKNVEYPYDARLRKEKGTVLLSFFVEMDGSISGVKVFQGVSAELDNEALRVAAKMPKWIPGKREDVITRMHYILPIKFALDGYISLGNLHYQSNKF